jgi:hypothetical protein
VICRLTEVDAKRADGKRGVTEHNSARVGAALRLELRSSDSSTGVYAGIGDGTPDVADGAVGAEAGLWSCTLVLGCRCL